MPGEPYWRGSPNVSVETHQFDCWLLSPQGIKDASNCKAIPGSSRYPTLVVGYLIDIDAVAVDLTGENDLVREIGKFEVRAIQVVGGMNHTVVVFGASQQVGRIGFDDGRLRVAYDSACREYMSIGKCGIAEFATGEFAAFFRDVGQLDVLSIDTEQSQRATHEFGYDDFPHIADVFWNDRIGHAALVKRKDKVVEKNARHFGVDRLGKRFVESNK